MNAARWGTVAVILGLAVFAGCRSAQPHPGGTPMTRGPAPTYDQVAEAYNARVNPLERLWARMVVRLKFVDGGGVDRSEQVEGHCMWARPSNVFVSFHKAGVDVAMLGSNQERFWWIELGGNKRAFVGTHANATPERVAAAGLRVHPLDLMELMGLTSLPAGREGCAVTWSSDGRSLVVTLPGRLHLRRMVLDPTTHRPSRIELLGDQGRIEAFADLSLYQPVALRSAGPGAARPTIPTDVRFETDAGTTRAIMQLSDPQDDPSRFRNKAVFDFARLIERNDVRKVTDLDSIPRAGLGP
jgi:hypothetical protein